VIIVTDKLSFPCIVVSVHRPMPLGSDVDVALWVHGEEVIIIVPPGRYGVVCWSIACVHEENWNLFGRVVRIACLHLFWESWTDQFMLVSANPSIDTLSCLASELISLASVKCSLLWSPLIF
jgi:hypothetical protein